MLYMLLATALLTVMQTGVRALSGELHPFEITFFRNLFALLSMLPLIARAGQEMRSRQPGLQLLRSTIGSGAMLTWFWGLSLMPLAEATALSFTAVVFGSVAAALLLGERMRARRWTAVGFGLAGALVILRPGLVPVSVGAMLVLLSSLLWGLALVCMKRLSRTDSTVCIVGWNSVLLTAFTLPFAVPVWVWPDPGHLAWLVLIGVLATGGHLAMTGAFRRADATAVFPIDFARMLWATALGYAVFGEVPDSWTWAGAALIFASTTYITYREARLARSAGAKA